MIALDIGNTKTAVGFFRGSVLARSWKLSTLPSRTADEYRIFLNACLSDVGESIRSASGMILASVVPSVTDEILRLKNDIDTHVVSPKTPLSFELSVPEPKTLGADRIANLEGGVRKHGAPVIVLDVGTATTLSVIDSKRRFLGGAIAPGLRISAEALFEKTALKPTDLIPPERAIGPTTREAIASGAVLGHARMIDGLIRQVREELSDSNVPVVATGGGIDRVVSFLQTQLVVDSELTLQGLRFLFENLGKGVLRA